MPIYSCAAAPRSDRERSIRIRSSRPTTGSTQAQVSWETLVRTPRGRYLVSCDQGAWTVGCGAVNGVSTEPDVAVALALYPENDPTTAAGTARAVQVGPQKTEIELDFDSAESARYVAEITSLPAAPMPVAFTGDEQTRSAIEEALKQRGVHVSLVNARDAASMH